MSLGRIVRMILLGFLVPGLAAQMSQQSPPSPERGARQSSRPSQTQPQVVLKQFSLLSGISVDVSPDWVEREQMPLPPSPRLAPFAPQVTFLEFMALENPRMHSALRIATTTNPFLGGDEVALDVQMHSAAGSGNGLADFLFYFFFSPPRDCLDGGSGGLQESKEAGRIAGSDCRFAGFEYSYRLQASTYASRLLLRAGEPRRVVSSHEWSGARRRNLSGVLSDADGKSGGERASRFTCLRRRAVSRSI